MSTAEQPPFIASGDKVILFDGVCKLCNAWSQFIIQHDHQQVFKLASVQSDAGQQILRFFNQPTDHFNSMLYIEGDRAYAQSEAFIRIVAQLGRPWRYGAWINVLPLSLRNWLYDRIALNRYVLFGRYEQCLLPSPDHAERFLNAAK